MSQHSSDKDRATVYALIQRIGTCMLVTHDNASDELRARPMAATPDEEEGCIWFLTDADSGKDREVRRNHAVCLAFADVSGQHYVSVTGTAESFDDRARVAELWSPAAKAFWDDKNDPNIRVLRVTPTTAEYWTSPGRIVTTVKMAAAIVTGGRPDLGENRQVEM